ncbi:hypothetical protein SS50377_20755 [Spironucleus salmonicida]|uniref:Uncharacterized protein n=1 Tax=Spironucleus salmonicida TaxID=348837 RepID=A0A9P8LZY0_9EUKA|nr:hypothetical protein SS50377_20755 [Spironucleus salmonicida]
MDAFCLGLAQVQIISRQQVNLDCPIDYEFVSDQQREVQTRPGIFGQVTDQLSLSYVCLEVNYLHFNPLVYCRIIIYQRSDYYLISIKSDLLSSNKSRENFRTWYFETEAATCGDVLMNF